MDRTALIAKAQTREPDAFTPASLSGPGRFDGCGDRPLAQAMDILLGDGWQDAEYGDASEPPFVYVGRIGRFLYSQDEAGFVNASEYATEKDADAEAQALTQTH
jgi:hypothetical protein